MLWNPTPDRSALSSPVLVGTRGGVGWMWGPCAQYISLTLFKHNNCSSFLRSNRPLLETILMSVSGVREMYWAPGPLSLHANNTYPWKAARGSKSCTHTAHFARAVLHPLKACIDKVGIVCKYRAKCSVLFLNG